LTLENQRRQARGEALLETLPNEQEQPQQEASGDTSSPEENVLLEESGRVLVDLIRLKQPVSAMR
jgi:hypothetical protein